MIDAALMKIRNRMQSQRKEVWEELKETMPESEGLVTDIAKTFGIEAIQVNDKSYCKTEYGRRQLESKTVGIEVGEKRDG